MTVPLELPEELMRRIEASAREQGLSFRDFVMNAIKTAVNVSAPAPSARFSQRVHDFGAHLESPWTVLSEIETEDYTRRYREAKK